MTDSEPEADAATASAPQEIDDWMSELTPELLRARGSMKWSSTEPGEIGAFIAELDTPVAPVVLHALQSALGEANTGYLGPVLSARVASACAGFQHRRFGWAVDPEHILITPDVLGALLVTLRHLVPAHLPIVLPTPAYMPFLLLPELAGRELRTVPMTLDAGRHTLDPAQLEAALQGGGLLILVNPHNPTGQVADRAELQQIAEIVERTGSTVFVDEIHSPMVQAPADHLPYASVSETAAAHSVTAVAASKGWNLPGLPCAQLILTSGVHQQIARGIHPVALHGATPLGAIASTAAYSAGIEHLDTVVEYLARGRAVFAAALAQSLPGAGYQPPEATYLHWLDLRPVGIDPATVRAGTGIWGTDGIECGAPGFLRLSLGTSHAIIADVAHRLGMLADRDAASAGSAKG